MSSPGTIFEVNGKFYVDIQMPDGKRFRQSCGRQRRTARLVLNQKRREIEEFQAEEISGTFAAAWRHYLHRLSKEGKLSSVRAAKERQQHWSSFNRRKIITVSQKEMDAFIDNMKRVDGTPRAIGGVNGSMKTLRAVLFRARGDGLISSIPFKLKKRKQIDQLPILVTRADFDALLAAIESTVSRQFLRTRLRALLSVGFHAGLRHSEALHLCVDDLDFEARAVLVTAKPEVSFSPKNWEERSCPMSRVLERELKMQLALLPDWSKLGVETGSRDWVFPRYRGSRFFPEPGTSNASMHEVQKIFVAAGLEPGMHRLRASFITRMLGAGADLGVVLRTAGHRNIEVIQRYIAKDEDAALQAVDRM